MNSEQLSAAAFGAASQALVAHSGTGLPAMGGKPGAQDVDLEDLFSLRRPKNVLSGASSGLQSVAKGARAAGCARVVHTMHSRRSRGAVPAASRLGSCCARLRHVRLCPSALLTRRTRDAAAGIIGGATALVAAPALGAREEGAVGFLKGLGAGAFQAPRLKRVLRRVFAPPDARFRLALRVGLASAVMLPVAGAAIGVVQIGRCVQALHASVAVRFARVALTRVLLPAAALLTHRRRS